MCNVAQRQWQVNTLPLLLGIVRFLVYGALGLSKLVLYAADAVCIIITKSISISLGSVT